MVVINVAHVKKQRGAYRGVIGNEGENQIKTLQKGDITAPAEAGFAAVVIGGFGGEGFKAANAADRAKE